MSYEELLVEADAEGIIVKEKPLLNNDGRMKGKKIAIRDDIPTLRQKAGVLAEEMGHYHTTVGRIVEQDTVDSVKQEYKARLWGYNRMIGLQGIIEGYEASCQNLYELARHLNVAEDFLQDALDCYRSKYGAFAEMDNYVIMFEPSLSVIEKL